MPVLRALLLLPLVLALACSGGGEETPAPNAGQAQPSDNASQSAPEPTEDPNTVEANPTAELEGGCETKPRIAEDGHPVLWANVRAVNTGNLGVRVRVAAFWPQPGGLGLSRFQHLSLEEGQSEDLRLRLVIGEEEAEAIEKVMSKGRECRANLRVTGAFGAPSD